ncbi:2-dehydropantoate 2-reductase [Geomonas silvestris]|uniref:2-dehydropantoate 2-reductase n=1 Tax=Geomonas silvestris TaxID=2740184 RepID=A0A6V8MKI0_9BACT|nr:ketopantoate reductase family protein [Geomonas silvestris]GFO60199.1 2-dehydropantoate 2-reductase [Geomonas silvestris]
MVAIIGAGALGAIYGSLLFQADPASVYFIAGGERGQRLSRDGVVVNGSRFAIPVRTPDEATPVELVIVAVKYHQLPQALAELRRAVGPHTVILSVMNGIDSEERLGEEFGPEKLLYGLSLGIDAVRVGNEVSYRNLGRIVFGEKRNEEHSDRVRQVAALFDRAGIAHHTPVDMIRSLWFKYMINVGVNQVSALLGLSYGGVRNDPAARELMEAAMREVIALAQALEVDLSEPDIQEFYRVLETLDADGKTSMLQDVEAGRKTEVEMLAGTVLALGERHGVATPVNRRLFEELRRLEAGFTP